MSTTVSSIRTQNADQSSSLDPSFKRETGASKKTLYSLGDITEKNDIMLEMICKRHFKSLFEALGFKKSSSLQLRHAVVRDLGPHFTEGKRWRENLHKDLVEKLGPTRRFKTVVLTKGRFEALEKVARSKMERSHALKVISSEIHFDLEKPNFQSANETEEWLNDPENWDALNKITVLNLRERQLRCLPKEIGRLRGLKKLYLDNNQLTTLPKEIGNLKQLEVLHIIDNRLRSLPEEIGNLTYLEDLRLKGNQLAGLPKTIGKLKELSMLHLENNKLASFPKEIRALTGLMSLCLPNNGLTSLPEAIRNHSQLKNLELQGNKLTSLPDAIEKLDRLCYLDLESHKFESLHEEIGTPSVENRRYLGVYKKTSKESKSQAEQKFDWKE